MLFVNHHEINEDSRNIFREVNLLSKVIVKVETCLLILRLLLEDQLFHFS